jgi:hypothetical protein
MKIMQMIRHTLGVGILAAFLVAGPTVTEGQGFDWPRWGGSDGSWISKETGWNPKALDGGLHVLLTKGVISLMAADGKLIVLNYKGMLFIAEASPIGFDPISKCDLLKGEATVRKFYTPPVLCKAGSIAGTMQASRSASMCASNRWDTLSSSTRPFTGARTGIS